MSHFSRENMSPYFEKWDALKEEILSSYRKKNGRVEGILKEALVNYKNLLDYGKVKGNEQSLLMPLNGQERLQFIEEQLPKSYAFIQLDALYDESRKKAARLSVTFK